MYIGRIESHSADAGLAGWCSHSDPGRAAAEPVELSLHVGTMLLRRLDATRPRPDVAQTAGRPTSGFHLPLSAELLGLIPKGTHIEFRDADGRSVELERGEPRTSIGTATDAGEALARRLNGGEVIDKWGSLKRPFSAKPHERGAYMTALDQCVRILHERLGLMVMPAYGTLLGYARHSAFLEHDDDVDLAVMLPATDVQGVADHFHHLVETLSSDGHDVFGVRTGQFQFRPAGRPDLPLMDLFAAWQSPDDRFHTYFGVSGPLSGKLRYRSGRLEGREIIVPEQYEEILALAYGERWRVPDPNFQWYSPAELRLTMSALESAGRVSNGHASNSSTAD